MSSTRQYKDPMASRYKRINLSLSDYQMEAVHMTLSRYKRIRSQADLIYRWAMEPESPISQDSRDYFHQVLRQLEANDMRVCA